MKKLSQRWFTTDRRKPRLVKKLTDKANRRRSIYGFFFRHAFTILHSEAEIRLIKASMRDARIPVDMRREMYDRMLIHRRSQFKCSIIRTHEGNVSKPIVINPKDLDWYRATYVVSKVRHYDGREESFLP